MAANPTCWSKVSIGSRTAWARVHVHIMYALWIRSRTSFQYPLVLKHMTIFNADVSQFTGCGSQLGHGWNLWRVHAFFGTTGTHVGFQDTITAYLILCCDNYYRS